MAVLIELLIVLAIIIILILILIPLIAGWLWPPPPPPCGLIRRTVLPDYCPGNGICPPGQTCVATGTRPYPAWMGGWAPSTQATACACVPVPPPSGSVAPPGSGSATAPGSIAPVTGSSTTERPR